MITIPENASVHLQDPSRAGASDGPRARARRRSIVLAAVVALVYLWARPPIYERDGFVYHLLGRDFLSGLNPHHLLWNAVQWLINRLDALVGINSVVAFQLAGMACVVGAVVLLHDLLIEVGASATTAFAASLFTAFTPWVWFMAFQNQPYAPMFLLFVVYLRCFGTHDGELPRGRRFAGAAASAVGMVMLQQAAVLIIIGAGVCFLILAGWRRALAWTAATAVPTSVLYVVLGAMTGVRSPSDFWRWATGYLHSQHSLQTRLPDSVVQSAMGVLGAVMHQEPFRDRIVDEWSASAILWFYGLVGVGMLAALATVAVRNRRTTATTDARTRPLGWICLAAILSWSAFCFLWEPTNYYWFILLAPLLVHGATQPRFSRRMARIVVVLLGVASVWNLYGNRYVDAAGITRAPGPQMQMIQRHLDSTDLLLVVDLGWSGDVDYDLLATTVAFEHAASIVAVTDIVGRSPDAPTWRRTIETRVREVFARGGRVFLSGRTFVPETYERTWEESPFADYQVERRFPVNWESLAEELPAFIKGSFNVAPAGFRIGSDTIWRLEPRRASSIGRQRGEDSYGTARSKPSGEGTGVTTHPRLEVRRRTAEQPLDRVGRDVGFARFHRGEQVDQRIHVRGRHPALEHAFLRGF